MSNTEARAALDAYHSRRRQAAGRSFVSSAAGYQRVLPRDVERRLERVFASMDKNHDWALEKAEVAQVLGTESDCMLDMVDVNKDYKVTIEEWMRYFNNLWQFMPDSVHHHIEVVERRVRGGSQYHATAVTAGYQRIVPPDVERHDMVGPSRELVVAGNWICCFKQLTGMVMVPLTRLNALLLLAEKAQSCSTLIPIKTAR
eukprot:TRINITY_DN4220_c0_g2_i1.p1 TRINITY_DN4220_c0_g2~~TRINITY_DN4220_c0_g2_i1.p1  ORF type:complete len:201 (+),score=37.28 TRINITY_DN4220_c0_g2_i1:228-830(+)